MRFFEKIKNWFVKNKEIILKGGGILLLAGTGIAYVISNKGKISFDEWLGTASTDELEDAHERLRTEEFLKTGTKPYEMERISEELGARGQRLGLKSIPKILTPISDGPTQIDGSKIKAKQEFIRRFTGA